MRIGIDAMGGDFAPESVVAGAVLVALESPEINIVLIGKKDKIEKLLAKENFNGNNLTILPADEIIEMGEHPAKAIMQKPNASISVGFQRLKAGEIDAFCSAGNTGAMMVGALFSVKAIKGVVRPAIAGFVPQIDGNFSVLLDIGANADCKPEMLNQFAELGSIYYQAIKKKEKPRVALMNIGEEEQKGSLLCQAAHQLMKKNDAINFIGNIEGKDFFKAKADVIVTDGFTGNVILKMGESLYTILYDPSKKNAFLENTNYEATGGSPIIGVNGHVIIGHGISTPIAIKNMILLAKQQVDAQIYQKIVVAFSDRNDEN